MHLNGNLILKPEYNNYDKVKNHVFRNYYYYILKKADGCIAVMDPKNTGKEPMKLIGEKMWVNKYVFSLKGTDTTVFYLNEFLNMQDYRKNENALNERDDKIAQLAVKKNFEEEYKKQKEAQINSIRGKYIKTEKITLVTGKTVYILVDSNGVKCLNEETISFDYPNLKLISYWKADGQVFVKKENGKWLQYPNDKEYETINSVGFYMAAIDLENNCTIFNRQVSRTFKIDKNTEVTSFVDLGDSYYYAYKMNNKYGFASYDNYRINLKLLPAVFDSLKIIDVYNNNPQMQLIYKGEKFNAFHDGIKMSAGQASVIKGDVYGIPCGNPICKNGIIGYTNQTIKGTTSTKTFNNTTVWKNGHLEVGNVTITETTSDQTVKEEEPCTDPIHNIKNVWLLFDPNTGKYKIEKK